MNLTLIVLITINIAIAISSHLTKQNRKFTRFWLKIIYFSLVFFRIRVSIHSVTCNYVEVWKYSDCNGYLQAQVGESKVIPKSI